MIHELLPTRLLAFSGRGFDNPGCLGLMVVAQLVEWGVPPCMILLVVALGFNDKLANQKDFSFCMP